MARSAFYQFAQVIGQLSYPFDHSFHNGGHVLYIRVGIRPAGFVPNSLGEPFQPFQLLAVIGTKNLLRFVSLDELGGEMCRLTSAGHIFIILFLFGFQDLAGAHFTFRRAKVRRRRIRLGWIR